jgi:hypothetical protein
VSDSTDPMSIDEWLGLLDATLADARPARITTGERRLLLEIARLAAHASERVAAPITTYRLGLALASVPTDMRTLELERVRTALDDEA